jgi:hypothetical protein
LARGTSYEAPHYAVVAYLQRFLTSATDEGEWTVSEEKASGTYRIRDKYVMQNAIKM